MAGKSFARGRSAAAGRRRLRDAPLLARIRDVAPCASPPAPAGLSPRAVRFVRLPWCPPFVDWALPLPLGEKSPVARQSTAAATGEPSPKLHPQPAAATASSLARRRLVPFLSAMPRIALLQSRG